MSGAVRNADRKCKAFSLRSKIWFPRVGNQIWVSTPQNRTYRGLGLELELHRMGKIWACTPQNRTYRAGGIQPIYFLIFMRGAIASQ